MFQSFHQFLYSRLWFSTFASDLRFWLTISRLNFVSGATVFEIKGASIRRLCQWLSGMINILSLNELSPVLMRFSSPRSSALVLKQKNLLGSPCSVNRRVGTHLFKPCAAPWHTPRRPRGTVEEGWWVGQVQGRSPIHHRGNSVGRSLCNGIWMRVGLGMQSNVTITSTTVCQAQRTRSRPCSHSWWVRWKTWQ